MEKVENEENPFEKLFNQLINLKLCFYVKKFNLFKNEFLIISTFVNPDTKKFKNSHEDDINKYLEIIISFFSKYYKNNPLPINQIQIQEKNTTHEFSDSSDDENIRNNSNDIQVLKNELYDYLSEGKPTNIYDFWENSKKKYPHVYNLFKIYYNICATSTTSERLFSDTGYQIWDRRNRLSPNKVEEIMFIYENNKLKELIEKKRIEKNLEKEKNK